MAKKIVRVLVPCWTVEIIYAIFNGSSFEIEIFIRHILCIDINWYIRYLFYCYFVFWISSFSKYRIYIIATFSILSLLLPEIEAEQSFSFIIGILFSEFKCLSNKRLPLYGIGCLFLSVIFLTVKQFDFIRVYEGTIIFNIIQLLIKCPAALSILLLYKKISLKRTNKCITFIGLCSYELYLTHCKFLYLINDKSMFGVIIFYLLSFITAYILYKFDNYIIKKHKDLCLNS